MVLVPTKEPVPVTRERSGYVSAFCIDYQRDPPKAGLPIKSEGILTSNKILLEFGGEEKAVPLETELGAQNPRVEVRRAFGGYKIISATERPFWVTVQPIAVVADHKENMDEQAMARAAMVEAPSTSLDHTQLRIWKPDLVQTTRDWATVLGSSDLPTGDDFDSLEKLLALSKRGPALARKLAMIGFKPADETPDATAAALERYRTFAGVNGGRGVLDPDTETAIDADRKHRIQIRQARARHQWLIPESMTAGQSVAEDASHWITPTAWLGARGGLVELWFVDEGGDVIGRERGSQALARAEEAYGAHVAAMSRRANAPAILVASSAESRSLTVHVNAQLVTLSLQGDGTIDESSVQDLDAAVRGALAGRDRQDLLVVRGAAERALDPAVVKGLGRSIVAGAYLDRWLSARYRTARVWMDDPAPATLERVAQMPSSISAKDIEAYEPSKEDSVTFGSSTIRVLEAAGIAVRHLGDEADPSKAAVIVFTGHKGPDLFDYIDKLGVAGVIKGKIVLLLSCGDQISTLRASGILRAFGAKGVLVVDGLIHPDAAVRVIEGIGVALHAKGSVATDRLIEVGIEEALKKLDTEIAKYTAEYEQLVALRGGKVVNDRKQKVDETLERLRLRRGQVEQVRNCVIQVSMRDDDSAHRQAPVGLSAAG
jgi:hypothetical protein